MIAGRCRRAAALSAAVLLSLVAGCEMPHIEAAGGRPAEQPESRPPGQPVEPEETPEREPEPLEQPPGLAIADVSASESDATLAFTVSLSRASADPVSVAYATEDGTATAGADYEAARGTLSFAAGSATARQVEVRVRDDLVAEAAETFILRLSDPQGATLAVAAATGTISDDDRRSVTVQPAELNVIEGQSARYTVVLGSRPTAPVTVAAAGGGDLSVDPPELRFAPSAWAAAQTVTVTAARDDDALADAPVELAHAVRGGDYQGAAAGSVTVTIVEVDAPTLAVAAARAPEGERRVAFAVSLSLAGDAAVSVAYATGASGDTASAGGDYAPASGRLEFPARSTAARTIAVTVRDDALDEPDERFTVTLSDAVNAGLAGGGRTATASATIADDDEPPALTIAGGSVGEGGGEMPFAVTLAAASGRTVTVDYATADRTAAAGADYGRTRGTLTFAPGGALRQTIAVPIADDPADEPDEAFTVTLSAAVHATLDAGGRTATGTIADDDDRGVLVEPAALTLRGGAGTASYTVALTSEPTEAVTVQPAVPAAAAVTVAPAVLTFAAADWATAQTVTVSPAEDATGGDTATIAHTVSGGDYDGEPAASVTVTIAELSPLELASLQVTGGGTMYPDFDADTRHYALTCEDSTTLRVAARARRSGARLTLLRADPGDNHESTTNLDVQVTVNRNDDVVIELSDADGTATYVVHCLPSDFPDINILKHDPAASDGMLLVTPRWDRAGHSFGGIGHSYAVALDNNGVPRFHRQLSYSSSLTREGINFRRHADGRYSISRRETSRNAVDLYDDRLEFIESVGVVQPLSSTDYHDFLVTPEGNYLFISYQRNQRNVCEIADYCDEGETTRIRAVLDSVIQEVTPAGASVFLWNSWGHVKLADCLRPDVARHADYAHVNSLFVADGDIIASFRHCNQVLRIDRSDGTGAVEWQLGGTSPPRAETTEYLEITGDSDGSNEFCRQHHATLTDANTTDANTVVLFDNGHACRGPRKDLTRFSRAVEYDISSGTQAVFRRQVRLPSEQGYSASMGAVTVLNNGNWLIAWGRLVGATVAGNRLLTVSEVDPDGTTLFSMNMDPPQTSNAVRTYRAYRASEADIRVPLNLP